MVCRFFGFPVKPSERSSEFNELSVNHQTVVHAQSASSGYQFSAGNLAYFHFYNPDTHEIRTYDEDGNFKQTVKLK
jgi:hypothetical protein